MVHSDPDARLRKMLAPGNLFEEKYRVVSKLGTGSFAIVVKASHEVMGRDVALKCLKPSVVRSNPEVSERFVNEVQIVSRLRHPNTVTIFDFGQTDDDLVYMVLEYLEGHTLDELIDTDGPLDEARAIHICRQVLKSLAEAHALGIVHRDLKPSNIMLTELHGEPDFVKVLDFGVAKLLEDSEKRNTRFEPRSTQFIGTPVYMSPEQVLGQSVSPASDVYSLGLILYEMLTGETPIAHDSVAAVVREHLDDAPLPLAKIDQLSQPMQELIRRATARQPQRRFQTVKQFARALPVDGAVESIERAQPVIEAEPAPAAGLREETSEPDVFSGKNYVAPPEIDEEDEPGRAAARLRAQRAKQRRARAARAERAKAKKPAPSLRTDELDLDLDSVQRQRRRVEHRRRQRAANSREVDGSWEMREYWTRYSVYLAGVVGGYWAFVVLSAMMNEQSGAVRAGGGLLIVISAVMGAGFSGTQAVGVDVGRRWLMPTAKNLVYICVAIIVVGLFWHPEQTAHGLASEPTWFFDAMPEVPPLTWLDSLTAAVAGQLAGLFEFMARVLPY